MMTSAFSQTIYPRKIVIENDTIVCVTPAQLKTVVLDLNTGEYLQVENDLLKKQISKSDSLCVYWQKISEEKDTLIIIIFNVSFYLYNPNYILQITLLIF